MKRVCPFYAFYVFSDGGKLRFTVFEICGPSRFSHLSGVGTREAASGVGTLGARETGTIEPAHTHTHLTRHQQQQETGCSPYATTVYDALDTCPVSRQQDYLLNLHVEASRRRRAADRKTATQHPLRS